MIVKLQNGASMPLRFIRALIRVLSGGKAKRLERKLRDLEELSDVADGLLSGSNEDKEERHYKGRDVPYGVARPPTPQKPPPEPKPKSKDERNPNSSND